MATNERYTTKEKVYALMRWPVTGSLSTSTNPTAEGVENLIDEKMDDMDEEVKTSWHMSRSREYHHDDGDYIPYSGVRIFLDRRNIVTPLDATLGDSLKIFDGNSWSEYVGVKTEGRNNDFWFDEIQGVLYLKTSYSWVRHLEIDINYRYNEGGRTLLNDANGLTNSETGSFTVDSTAGFPEQGWFRIDDEEVRYNSKTATTFNVIERGAYGTTAATHSDNAIIFWCPKDVESTCTKLVAIDLLTTEDWSSGGLNSGEMGSAQMGVQGKINEFKKDVERFYATKRPILAGLR